MGKGEKIIGVIAYASVVLLTLLPFFGVGIASCDDWEYLVTSQQTWHYWMVDAENYAHTAGRFYFLVTKFFYYIPYLFNSIIWTKTLQYGTLIFSYLLFSYLIHRIFSSRKLGLLTFFFLVAFTSIPSANYVLPISFPFYFTFSCCIFLIGVLLFLNYVEKKGYWRVVVSALLFFVAYLFYENYLIFALAFCCCLLIRNIKIHGFVGALKTKGFYAEIIPYFVVSVAYVACYVAYRQYLLHTMTDFAFYGGSSLAANFNWGHFFEIIGNLTVVNLPAANYFGNLECICKDFLSQNGHQPNLIYILAHSSIATYVNVFIQCGIVWYIVHNTQWSEFSWKKMLVCFGIAFLLAFSSHILIGVAEKYNSTYCNLRGYVTSYYSYFFVMLMFVIAFALSFRFCRSSVVKKIVLIAWLMVVFIFSVLNNYANEHMGREWQKCQDRIDVTDDMIRMGFFDSIQEGSIIYDKELNSTLPLRSVLCYGNYSLRNYLDTKVGKKYFIIGDKESFAQTVGDNPDNSVYYVQTPETQQNGDWFIVCSHLSHLDTNDVENSLADESDLIYYSSAKEFVLYYTIFPNTDSSKTNAITFISDNKQAIRSHIKLRKQNLSPSRFSVSNVIIPTKDTLYLH